MLRGFLTCAFVALSATAPALAQLPPDPASEARSLVERAVTAYDEQREPALAVGLLKRALTLDPTLHEAHLHLAVIHQLHSPPDRGRQFAEQELLALLEKEPTHLLGRLHLALLYMMDFQFGSAGRFGGPSEETRRRGEQARSEFVRVLQQSPENLVAVDGYAALLSWLGSEPYAEALMEAKALHLRHVAARPTDPEPYVWMADIAITLAAQAEYKLRQEHNAQRSEKLQDHQPLPEELRARFVETQAANVDEGIHNAAKALELAPGWPQAIVSLHYLYRFKAQMADSEQDRGKYEKQSQELRTRAEEFVRGDLHRAYTPYPEPSTTDFPLRLLQLAQLEDKRLYQRTLIPTFRYWSSPHQPDTYIGSKSQGPRSDGPIALGEPVRKPPPIYPLEAREAGIEGTVRLRAFVGKDGKVNRLEVLDGPPPLVKAALDAVVLWQYEPARANGEPVEAQVTVEVVFRLHPK